MNRGTTLMRNFEQLGNLADISEAISIQQQAVQLTPTGHPNVPVALNNLGNSLVRRFERTGDLSDISEAISALQRAVQLTPNGHTYMLGQLCNLGVSFLCHFECTGDLSDISEAISNLQCAIQLTPDGHLDTLIAQLNNLGTSFLSHFERTGDLSDISEAISALQRAVQLTPDGQPDASAQLSNLGGSFLRRFERTGDPSDISEAISNLQRAIQLTPDGHSDMPAQLNNLGNSFLCRFKRRGDLSDLSEGISTLQHAVQLLPSGHSNMPAQLNSLGYSLLHRFEHMGDLADISGAISAIRHAVQLTPNGHPNLPLRLNNLGNIFLRFFRHTGDVSHRYAAMDLYQKSATSLGNPSDRLTAAQNWAQHARFLDPPAAMRAYAIAIELVSQIAGMDRTIEQRHSDLVNISSLTTAAASAAFAQNEIERALEWLEQGRCLVWSQLNQLRTPVDDLRAHDARLAQRFLEVSTALESSGSRRGLGAMRTDAPWSQKTTLQDEARIHTHLACEWNQLLEEIRDIQGFHNFLRPPQASELLRHIPPDGPIVLINVDKSRCDALALIYGCTEPLHIPLKEFKYEQASNLSRRLRNFLSWHGVRLRDNNRALRPAPDPRVKSDIHCVLGALWLEVVSPILESLSYPVSLNIF